jgi:hypothetical protein
MRQVRLASLALAALLSAACGDVLHELDAANELASKPGGNRPVPVTGQPSPGPGGAAPATPAGAAAVKPAAPAAEEPGILARVEGWLGIGGAQQNARRPPDPNDPMVVCRLGGSASFMLKSGCVNRQGVVVANKGAAH